MNSGVKAFQVFYLKQIWCYAKQLRLPGLDVGSLSLNNLDTKFNIKFHYFFGTRSLENWTFQIKKVEKVRKFSKSGPGMKKVIFNISRI